LVAVIGAVEHLLDLLAEVGNLVLRAEVGLDRDITQLDLVVGEKDEEVLGREASDGRLDMLLVVVLHQILVSKQIPQGIVVAGGRAVGHVLYRLGLIQVFELKVLFELNLLEQPLLATLLSQDLQKREKAVNYGFVVVEPFVGQLNL